MFLAAFTLNALTNILLALPKGGMFLLKSIALIPFILAFYCITSVVLLGIGLLSLVKVVRYVKNKKN